MNESIPITVAGIDVGKAKLDVHLLEGGVDRVFRNDKGGRRAVRNWLLRHGVTPRRLRAHGALPPQRYLSRRLCLFRGFDG